MTSTLPPPPDTSDADATFVPPPAPVEAAPFEQLRLAAPVLVNLARLGYHQMTPIQAASLPVALARNDLLALQVDHHVSIKVASLYRYRICSEGLLK